jgi:hypothetical protein
VLAGVLHLDPETLVLANGSTELLTWLDVLARGQPGDAGANVRPLTDHPRTSVPVSTLPARGNDFAST